MQCMCLAAPGLRDCNTDIGAQGKCRAYGALAE